MQDHMSQHSVEKQSTHFLQPVQIRGVDPYTWLKNALNKIPDYLANQLEKLLHAN